MMKTLLSAVLLLPLFAPLSAQQDTSKPPIPQIVVTGRGEVKVTPDRATVQISVQSHALTAAAAAAENARKQSTVIAAIRALGVGDDQISTANYTVSPEHKYLPNSTPVLTGYMVTNTVVAEVRSIKTVGAVIDAALSHGANLITGLSFFASNTESARRTAIALAVASARADAEAAAKAANGTLGGLLEIDIGAHGPPVPRPMMMMRGAVTSGAIQVETPISPGQESVIIEVTTRWRFLGG